MSVNSVINNRKTLLSIFMCKHKKKWLHFLCDWPWKVKAFIAFTHTAAEPCLCLSEPAFISVSSQNICKQTLNTLKEMLRDNGDEVLWHHKLYHVWIYLKIPQEIQHLQLWHVFVCHSQACSGLASVSDYSVKVAFHLFVQVSQWCWCCFTSQLTGLTPEAETPQRALRQQKVSIHFTKASKLA